MSDDHAPDFIEDVFPTEQASIRRRREREGVETDRVDGDPDVEQGLVGLAISGGGIRSASFALGVIQGLAGHGLLRHVDYLSTVSGGGYIGSSLSALLNRPENRPQGREFPLRYTAESSEPRALTHLRNCSNYLAPAGLLSTLRLPNLMLRGILLNIFVFLPFIMAAVFVTELTYEFGPHWDSLPKLVPPAVGVFLVMALVFPFLVRVMRPFFDWKRRNTYELWLTIPLLFAAVVLLFIPLLHITRLAIEHDASQLIDWATSLPPGQFWRLTFVLLVVIGLFMLAGKASENVGRVAGKILLWIVGLLGPAVIYLIFLAFCLWQIKSPYLPVGSAAGLNAAAGIQTPCLQTSAPGRQDDPDCPASNESFWSLLWQRERGPATAAQLVNALGARGVSTDERTIVRCGSGNCGEKPPADWCEDTRQWVINTDPRAVDGQVSHACPDFAVVAANDRCPARGDRAVADGGDASHCIYVSRISADSFRLEGPGFQQFWTRDDTVFVLVFLGLLLFNRLLLDINITSPHGFYRDRLSRAFLFRIDEKGHAVPEDEIRLSELNAKGTSAPYHLINVALNLQGSRAPDLRGRECDFFTFSRDFCGGERTGWSTTREMERYDRHLDLATAMAISGAAAAPNMGTTTNRALVFIMTLLNIRLGYWLPNPRRVNGSGLFKHFALSSAKPTLIWKEALGRLDERGSHVNISDGGHIENLAIYQLLKRRCKFIIAIDGECDPAMRFGGLATLMRFARIDLGVEIRMDLDDLRKAGDGLSRNHWCLGEIRYADGGIGQLLYVKLSVTGDEPEYVRAYREKHPDFPHQSTADQFFSEAQFEAYRALGEHACEGMLADVDNLGGFAALSEKPRSNAET